MVLKHQWFLNFIQNYWDIYVYVHAYVYIWQDRHYDLRSDWRILNVMLFFKGRIFMWKVHSIFIASTASEKTNQREKILWQQLLEISIWEVQLEIPLPHILRILWIWYYASHYSIV